MKIVIINGPNLNLIGEREKEIYGIISFEQYFEELQRRYNHVKLVYYQSNIEGEIINKLHEVGFKENENEKKGIIINAGGYSHTSVAIADAIAAIKVKVVEVHISNVFSREGYRHISLIASKCKGSICGFGLTSYELGIESFIRG